MQANNAIRAVVTLRGGHVLLIIFWILAVGCCAKYASAVEIRPEIFDHSRDSSADGMAHRRMGDEWDASGRLGHQRFDDLPVPAA